VLAELHAGAPGARYADEGTQFFERIHKVEAAFIDSLSIRATYFIRATSLNAPGSPKTRVKVG